MKKEKIAFSLPCVGKMEYEGDSFTSTFMTILSPVLLIGLGCGVYKLYTLKIKRKHDAMAHAHKTKADARKYFSDREADALAYKKKRDADAELHKAKCKADAELYEKKCKVDA